MGIFNSTSKCMVTFVAGTMLAATVVFGGVASAANADDAAPSPTISAAPTSTNDTPTSTDVAPTSTNDTPSSSSDVKAFQAPAEDAEIPAVTPSPAPTNSDKPAPSAPDPVLTPGPTTNDSSPAPPTHETTPSDVAACGLEDNPGIAAGPTTNRATSDSSACPTPLKQCTPSEGLTHTRNANLSEVTITLQPGFAPCDVSLDSYQTEGVDWVHSGTQIFNDHATARLTLENPTATLKVMVKGCFQQQDLYIGTTRYDGTDGALPHYPSSWTPPGLIDHWNGAAECAPPVVTPPHAVVTSVCTADGPNTRTDMSSGNQETTFQIYVNGVSVEEHSVPANTTLTSMILLGQDSFGGSTTVEVKSGEVSLFVLPLSTNCAPPVVVHPENVTFPDFCGVKNDAINAPGSQVGDAVTSKDPVKGDTTSTENDSEQGGYFINDTMSPAGVRSAQVLFLQYGTDPIAERGEGDTYTIVTIDGIKYAQWTYTFNSEPCPLTVITTPSAPEVIPATCDVDGSLPPLKDGEGYTVAYNHVFDGPGAYKAVYTAKEGTTFKEGLSVSYDLVVASKLTSGCPTTGTTPPTGVNPPTDNVSPAGNNGTPPTSLAHTGGGGSGELPLIAIIALLVGLMLVNPIRNRVFGFVRRVAGQTGRHVQP